MIVLAPTKPSPLGMHDNQGICECLQKNMVIATASLDSSRIITTN